MHITYRKWHQVSLRGAITRWYANVPKDHNFMMCHSLYEELGGYINKYYKD